MAIPTQGKIGRAHKNQQAGFSTKRGKRAQRRFVKGKITQRQRDRRTIRAGMRKTRPELTKKQVARRSVKQERAMKKYHSTVRIAAGL